MNRLIGSATAITLAMALTAGAASSQTTDDRRPAVELRGGINVPTFDIADVAEAGPSFGASFILPLQGKLSLLAEADFGLHESDADPDVTLNVYHGLVKLGYDIYRQGPLSIMVNAGAGVMSFEADVDGAETFTYPAINVGAKATYAVSDRLSVVLSPQGDIAFSDEAELSTDNSWVWPFTAGVRIGF